MQKRTIIVPLADNQGVSLASEHKNIAASLLKLAGGFSVHTQDGWWLADSGQAVHDESLVYTTLCDEATDQLIMDKLPEWCEATRQDCILTDVQSVQAEFITAPQRVKEVAA